MRNILYYIGAGLPKAMEPPERPVPLMYDFVRVMAAYVEDNVILTTLAELVNAGIFSTRSSETEDLARRVVGQTADRSAGIRAAFRTALEALPPESIEVLLERAAAATNASAGGADVRFRYAINRVFYLIASTLDWSRLDRFLQRQLGLADSTHTFIDFDYDLILDRAVQRFERLWAVQSGYGFDIPFYTIRENLGATADGTTVHDAEPFAGELPSSVLLLKPHGSLSWLLPYQFRDTSWRFDEEPIIVPLAEDGTLRYVSSTSTFQHVAFPNRGRIGNVEPLIIPPTYDKLTDLPFLLKIRDQADDALRSADEVYIIGWSMPATDVDHQKSIAKIARERAAPLKRLVLVSRNMPQGDIDCIQRTFNVSRMELFNQGFTDFVDRVSI